ncbi:MAG: hypothetical protein J6L81_02740 [Clostridia bacterium]|nr:hypothetical protein [Clostridia bacterium]
MKTNAMNMKLLLVAAFGHLLCWAGGDMLLYFIPNGPLDVMGLFDYYRTAEMLEGANPLQFTVSGIAGTIAMMLALLGYYQIYQFLKPVAKGAANVAAVGALLTTIPGAVMHFTCTSMLWYFVKSGATKEAHDIMLSFFMETSVTSAMCNIGVFMVCIALFVAVVRGKTCLPKWACLINTIPFTMLAGIALAGMGAMNVGSAMMFLGLYFCIRKYSKEKIAEQSEI